MITQNLKYS